MTLHVIMSESNFNCLRYRTRILMADDPRPKVKSSGNKNDDRKQAEPNEGKV